MKTNIVKGHDYERTDCQLIGWLQSLDCFSFIQVGWRKLHEGHWTGFYDPQPFHLPSKSFFISRSLITLPLAGRFHAVPQAGPDHLTRWWQCRWSVIIIIFLVSQRSQLRDAARWQVYAAKGLLRHFDRLSLGIFLVPCRMVWEYCVIIMCDDCATFVCCNLSINK